MRSKFLIAATTAITLSTVIASAQTGTKIFDFVNKPDSQGLEDVANILRTIVQLRDVQSDAAASTLGVTGTPDELALSEWIVRQVDHPAGPSGGAGPAQYVAPGNADDVVRVFHLKNVPPAQQAIREILTTLRAVGDIQMTMGYTALTDVVVRAPATQIALAEYLLNSFDVVKGSVISAAEYGYQPPTPPYRPNAPLPAPQAARVFYLTHAATPQATQELMTVLRTVGDIQRIFVFTPASAIAVAGSAGEVATAGWMIQSLDIAATPPAAEAREYHVPPTPKGDSVIRVFYPTWINTIPTLNQTVTLLRRNDPTAKVFYDSNPAALIVRGTSEQIAKADQLIRELDEAPVKPAQ